MITRLSLAAAVLLALQLSALAPAAAQAPVVVEVGGLARIRTHVPGEGVRPPRWVRGTVAGVTPDSIWLVPGAGSETRRFAAPDLAAVEWGVPRSPTAGAGRGSLIGAAILGGIGAVGGIALDGGDEGTSGGAQMLASAAAGALLGLTVGFFWGGERPGTRWLPAALPSRAP